MSKILPKLVRSYVLDGIETPDAVDDRTDREEAKRFLRGLNDSKFKSFPALGLGDDLRIESQTVAGGALVVDDRTVHLWAFPHKSEQPSKRERNLSAE